MTSLDEDDVTGMSGMTSQWVTSRGWHCGARGTRIPRVGNYIAEVCGNLRRDDNVMRGQWLLSAIRRFRAQFAFGCDLVLAAERSSHRALYLLSCIFTISYALLSSSRGIFYLFIYFYYVIFYYILYNYSHCAIITVRFIERDDTNITLWRRDRKE